MSQEYYSLVKNRLKVHKRTRDCDLRLYNNVLMYDFDYDFRYPVADLMWKIEEKRLPTMDTITRLRRKAQREHPELRGKKWDIRHGSKQDKAKGDLGLGQNKKEKSNYQTIKSRIQ